MPIQLTTPKSTGDLDPSAANGQYSQLKIIQQIIESNNRVLTVICQYGNTVDDAWVPGVLPSFGIRIEGTAYNAIVSETPTNTTDSVYTHAAKVLYDYLISEGIVAGTVV